MAVSFVLLHFHSCPPLREYETITRSNRERRLTLATARDRGRTAGETVGVSGTRRAGPPHAGGTGLPMRTGEGMRRNLGRQAEATLPEGDGVILPSCKPLALAMG